MMILEQGWLSNTIYDAATAGGCRVVGLKVGGAEEGG
jgi:hypothetical protein